MVNRDLQSKKHFLPLGLRLNPLEIEEDKITPIAENLDYSYFILKLTNKSEFQFKDFSSICAFIPQKNNNLQKIIANNQTIKNGSCILLNNSDLEISDKVSEGLVLIAGTKKNNPNKEKKLLVNNISDHYKVIKPWGHELWINYGQEDYSFKEVYLKSEYQTSLQYHELKKETAILYDGTCEVIFKKDADVLNDNVNDHDLDKIMIEPFSTIDVEPLVLHRIKALSNIYHYEVSTPFLDDVIRVSDDNNRKNGKIPTEHTN